MVVGTDDSTPGQVYLYVGTKKKTGNPVEKAGLSGGMLYGISTPGAIDEYDAKTGGQVPGGFNPKKFTLVDVRDASKDTAQLPGHPRGEGDHGVVAPREWRLGRKEPNVFYFNTTAKVGAKSRPWKLTFKDITRPLLTG